MPVLEKNWPVSPSHRVAPGWGVEWLFLQQSSIDSLCVVWAIKRDGVNAYRKIKASVTVSSMMLSCMFLFFLIAWFRDLTKVLTEMLQEI